MRKNRLPIAVSIAALAVLGACAGPEKLATSTRIPAAQAKVAVTSEANRNTGIDLKVRHLAPPDKVDPQATTYMVWAKPKEPGAPLYSLGALRPDRDLRAELKTTTPLKEFDLFVTAENSTQVTQPSGQPLMWTHISRR